MNSPYVGLRPFQQSESLLFFGRRQQIGELMDRLHETRFLAIVGSSGCGKSSLIRAGLMPRLEAGFLVENRDRWVFSTLTPGSDPLDRLAASFDLPVKAIHEEGAFAITNRLLESDAGGDRNCFVLVDQFEELFRFAAANRDQAADFVQILLSLVSQRDFPVFVAITMRSDFLGECDAFTGLPEALNRSQYFVPRLNRQQRREAIEGPVKLFRERMTPQLLDRLVNDVGDEPGQLPVLQHALLRTWEQWTAAGASGPLDLAHYESVGGIQGALSRDAEAALPVEGRDVAEKIFRRLTTTDAANRRIRRPALLSDLESVTRVGRAEILRILQPFQARSFVVVYERADGDSLVDISHESLIAQWDQLKQWTDAEAESKRIYLDLVTAVERKKALLHDADLQVALEWRKKLDPRTEREWALDLHPAYAAVIGYLEASVAEAESGERRRVRQRRLVWGFGLGLLAVSFVVFPLAVYVLGNAREASARAAESTTRALNANEEAGRAVVDAAKSRTAAEEARKQTEATLVQAEGDAREALAIRLGAEAQRLEITPERPFDAELRAMVAAQSLRIHPGFEGLNGLLEVLVKLPRRPRHFALPGSAPVSVIAFSPNRKQLASGHQDGRVLLWDIESGKVERELGSVEGAVYSLAFDADGKQVAAGGTQGVAIFSLASGSQKTLRTDNVAKSVCFHPNGELLAVVVQVEGTEIYQRSADVWKKLEAVNDPYNGTVEFDSNGVLYCRSPANSIETLPDSGMDRWKWVNPDPNRPWVSGMTFTSRLDRRHLRQWLGPGDELSGGAYDPFDRMAATGNRYSGIDLWDSRNDVYADPVKVAHEIRVLDPIPEKDSFLAIGPDDEISVIDGPTASYKALPKLGFSPGFVVFHPKLPWVVLSDPTTGGVVIDFSRRQIVWQWRRDWYGGAAFSSAGDRLFLEDNAKVGRTGGLHILKTGSWREAKVIPLESRDELRIDPAGRRIAVEHRVSFSRAETPPDVVSIFDSATGAWLETVRGTWVDQKWPRLFRTAADDPKSWKIQHFVNGTMAVVDPSKANGRVVTIPGNGGAITSDHKWVATAAPGGVNLWPLDPARVLDKACKQFLRRNLNAAELKVFRIPEKYQIPACPNLPRAN